jgi:uncharacterized MAPEG superfamily protein
MGQMNFPTELVVLTWGCILAFLHIIVAAQAKTRQYGSKWNMSARDEELPPARPVVGRLMRAQVNFFETFPILVAAVILALAAGPNEMTRIGGWLWLGGRVAYLPLYAFGVPVVRTIAWMASVVGIVLLMMPALKLIF